jgi:hypothetical protein
MTGFHAGDLQFPPVIPVLKERERPPKGAEQRFRRVVLENEPVWPDHPAGWGGLVRNSIGESSDAPDDRNGSVPKAVKLVQAAGLETGRHQEDIRSSLNQMGQTFVKPDSGRNTIRKLRSQVSPEVLIASVAGAKDHERGAEGGQVAGERGNQIEPFLIDHSRNHPDEGPLHCSLVAGQAEFLQYRGL